MQTEYVIWGCEPGRDVDTLLVAMPGGKPITDKAEVERIKGVLAQHGCHKLRVQTLDGALPDFACTVRR